MFDQISKLYFPIYRKYTYLNVDFLPEGNNSVATVVNSQVVYPYHDMTIALDTC